MVKAKGNLDKWLQRLVALTNTEMIDYSVNGLVAKVVTANDIANYMFAVRDGVEVIKGQLEKIKHLAKEKNHQDVMAVFDEEVEYGIDLDDVAKR